MNEVLFDKFDRVCKEVNSMAQALGVRVENRRREGSALNASACAILIELVASSVYRDNSQGDCIVFFVFKLIVIVSI